MTGSYSWMHITDTFQTNYKVPETLMSVCKQLKTTSVSSVLSLAVCVFALEPAEPESHGTKGFISRSMQVFPVHKHYRINLLV